MIHIARLSALIDFIKNICYNLYIKQKIKKLGTSIEAGPRHLSCNKTRAHKKKGGNCRPILHSTNANKQSLD